jgi:hypothetical protein
VAFYITLLGTEFFTRKGLKNARDMELPVAQSHDQVIEIIASYQRRKIGSLALRVDDLLCLAG